MSKRKLFHKFLVDLSWGLPKTKYYIFFRYTKNPVGVSFPKSGRTWVRKMLLDMSIRVPFSHAGSNNFEFGGSNDLNKCQDFFGNSVIFMTRDPRDVLMSYHHDLVWRHKAFSGDLMAMAKDPGVGIDAIAQFNINWVSNEKNFKNFMLIKYEDLQTNPENVVNNLCKYLGAFWVSRKKIRSVVEQSSFERMKKEELSGEFRGRYPSYWFEGGQPGGIQKVRKGKVGAFKEDMPTCVQEYCNERLNLLQYPRNLLCD